MGCAESSDSDNDEFGRGPQRPHNHPTNYSTHSSLHTNNSEGGNTAVAVMHHHLAQRHPSQPQQQQQYQSTKNHSSAYRPSGSRTKAPRSHDAKKKDKHQTLDCAPPPLDDTRTRAHSSDTALEQEGNAEGDVGSPLSSIHNNNNNSRGGSSGGVASGQGDGHIVLPPTDNEADPPIGFVGDDDFKVVAKKKMRPKNVAPQRDTNTQQQLRRQHDPPFGAPPVKTPTRGPPGDGFPAAFPSRERPLAKHHRLMHEWRGDDHQHTHGHPSTTTAPPSGAQQRQSGLSPAESQLLYALQAQQWQMGSDSWADVRQFNQNNNSNKKQHKKTQPKSKPPLGGNKDANNDDDGPPRRHWRTLDSGERSNWQNVEDQAERTGGPQTAQLDEPRPSNPSLKGAEGAEGGADGSSSSQPSRRQPGGDPVADSTSRGESVSNSSVVAVYAPHRPPQ